MVLRPLSAADRYAIQQAVVYNAVTKVLSEEGVYTSVEVRNKVVREALGALGELARRTRGQKSE